MKDLSFAFLADWFYGYSLQHIPLSDKSCFRSLQGTRNKERGSRLPDVILELKPWS